MSGINLSLKTIADLIFALYPGFIILFLLLISIFNYTILKGLIYLSGIILSMICWILIAKIFKTPKDDDHAISCDIISFGPTLQFAFPNRPSIITWFTLIYLLLPMLINYNMLFNPAIMIILLLFTIGNMYYQNKNKCSNWTGIFVGSFFGILFGGLWFLILWSSNKKDLLFYNELASNNVVCNKPAKQTFRCNVYKGGELVGNL